MLIIASPTYIITTLEVVPSHERESENTKLITGFFPVVSVSPSSLGLQCEVRLHTHAYICWGIVFKGGWTGHATTVVVDPTIQPWQLCCTCLPGLLGRGHHGLSVVIFKIRGDLFCGCLVENVSTFVPLIFVPAYPIWRGDFSCFIGPLYIEEQGTQSRGWNLIECLQRPFRLSLRNPKNSLSTTGILSLRLFVIQQISPKESVNTIWPVYPVPHSTILSNNL